jgi:GNAT superfamily N-acetyltransferase
LGVREDDWVGLFDIIVRPDVRRRGFGRRIVQALLGWAARTGAERAYLQVAEGNAPAVDLYGSLGFETAYTYRYFVKQSG